MSNVSSPNAQLSRVTFLNNSATDHGGGLSNNGSSPKVTNATFAGNSATFGGAIANGDSSNPVIKHVTVYDNDAAQYGGGMDIASSSSASIYNSIFWGNTANSNPAQIYNSAGTSPSVSDCVIQGGYSAQDAIYHIYNVDPKLGILSNYGGFTPTISLHQGSIAIDKANDAFCVATDQRGMPRPQGQGNCDIGAFEGTGYLVFVPAVKR